MLVRAVALVDMRKGSRVLTLRHQMTLLTLIMLDIYKITLGLSKNFCLFIYCFINHLVFGHNTIKGKTS
ncbi:hypothetical protein LguiA_026999 [Lonicera macranthoides]